MSHAEHTFNHIVYLHNKNNFRPHKSRYITWSSELPKHFVHAFGVFNISRAYSVWSVCHAKWMATKWLNCYSYAQPSTTTTVRRIYDVNVGLWRNVLSSGATFSLLDHSSQKKIEVRHSATYNVHRQSDGWVKRTRFTQRIYVTLPYIIY